MASSAAAVVFVLVYARSPALDLSIEGWPTIGAYVLAYGLISMLVLQPHDWWVNHLFASGEERLPRVEVLSTLAVLTPITIVLIYLYDTTTGLSRWIVYFLPILFLGLYITAYTTESTLSTRKMEIRILRSKGASYNQITSSIMWESGILAILGLFTGLLLTVTLTPVMWSTKGFLMIDFIEYLEFFNHLRISLMTLVISCTLCLLKQIILHVAP